MNTALFVLAVLTVDFTAVKGIPQNAKIEACVHDNARDWAPVEVTFADGQLLLKKNDRESAAFLVTFAL